VDYDTHEERAKKITPNYDSYSDRLKAEIIQAEYRGDWKGSPTTRRLLKEGDFEGAAKAFLDNDDYRASLKERDGLAARMKRVSDAIRAEGRR
jgi:hypothetical protein